MPPRSLIFTAVFVSVAGALVFLFVKVNAGADVDVSEASLSQARARYDRDQAASSRSPMNAKPTPSGAAKADTAARDRTSAKAPADRKDALNETDKAAAKEAQLLEIRKHFYGGKFEEALAVAQEFLRQDPMHPQVRRMAAISACSLGREQLTRQFYAVLPEVEKKVVRTRCAPFGMYF